MSPYSVTIAGLQVAERLTLEGARSAAEGHAARFPLARPTIYVYDADDPWPVDVLRNRTWSSTSGADPRDAAIASVTG